MIILSCNKIKRGFLREVPFLKQVQNRVTRIRRMRTTWHSPLVFYIAWKPLRTAAKYQSDRGDTHCVACTVAHCTPNITKQTFQCQKPWRITRDIFKKLRAQPHLISYSYIFYRCIRKDTAFRIPALDTYAVTMQRPTFNSNFYRNMMKYWSNVQLLIKCTYMDSYASWVATCSRVLDKRMNTRTLGTWYSTHCTSNKNRSLIALSNKKSQQRYIFWRVRPCWFSAHEWELWGPLINSVILAGRTNTDLQYCDQNQSKRSPVTRRHGLKFAF
jgi:hypothetical protein